MWHAPMHLDLIKGVSSIDGALLAGSIARLARPSSHNQRSAVCA